MISKLRSKTVTNTLAACTGVVLVFGSLAGCAGASDDDCQGDPGKVTAKDYDASYTTGRKKAKVTHPADYDLTIQRKDGSTYEKDVTSTAYDWYAEGSVFPSAKHCKNGKVVE